MTQPTPPTDVPSPFLEIALPDGWVEVPITSTNDADDILDSLFTVAADQEPARRAEIHRWDLQTRAEVARARQEGAVAVYRYTVATEGVPPFLVAGLVIFVRRLVDRLENMVGQLDSATKDVTTIELPDGRSCARVGRVAHLLVEGLDEQVTMQTYRYYTEVEDTDLVAALAFSTPNVPLADEFADLFDEIVASFRLVFPPGFLDEMRAGATALSDEL